MATNTSPLDTNLNINPYFDDYNQDSDYYRILFKPGTAVQTRELNQIQSMLQNQISKFGRNIYKEGSIIEGCALSFDNGVSYIKLLDTYSNGTVINPSDFVGRYLYNERGLQAIVIDYSDGYISQAPDTKTLYIKYLNSVQYANSSEQTTYDPNEYIDIRTSSDNLIGTIVIASNTDNASIGNPIGLSYNMSTSPGVVFKKGTFLYVSSHSKIISKYNNMPDGVSVGFDAVESFETAQSNSSLYDNAAGSPNFSAPGADRLKIVPSLSVRNTVDIANNTSFFSLADFRGGAVVTLRQSEQFSTIGAEMARRTYETNGDFVVTPFLISTRSKANTLDPLYANNVNLIVGRGLGYVKGNRVEYINNISANLRKGVDYESLTNQIVTANFGSYVNINEFAGELSDSNVVIQVELHSVAKHALSYGNLISIDYSNSTKIGTAYVRGVVYDNGTIGAKNCQYRLYIFNVVMSPGKNFRDVKSIIQFKSNSVKGVADIVLSYNASSDSYGANFQDTSVTSMIFPFGQRAIRKEGLENASFYYTKKFNTSFQSTTATGNGSIDITGISPTAQESFPYTSSLTSTEQKDFIVVSTSDGYSTNLTGQATVVGSSTTVTGSGGAQFLIDYRIGDYISVNGEDRLIEKINSNISLTVSTPFVGSAGPANHRLAFPTGSIIPFGGRDNRNITIISSTSARLTLNKSLVSNFSADVYASVYRSNSLPITKNLNTNVYVKINCETHMNGFSGPTWSLGIPDVVSIQAIYIADTYAAAVNGTNYVSSFTLDNGQKDTHYGLASITKISNSPAANILKSTSKIVVVLSCYTIDDNNGRGYFTAASYPVNDVSTDPTMEITTDQIPVYITNKGTAFDLRDCVDFRPFASNTAVIATNLNSAAPANPVATLSLNVNPYIPVPDSIFMTDIAYYLQRSDRVSIDIDGNIIVKEGKPDTNTTTPPPEVSGAMTIGIANIPPYPSLPTNIAKISNRYDYAITVALQQNKRFTMKDIGVLEKRIENLEYYTSLSLLEQAASNLLVKSDSSGLNRFQNGIFVDPFKGFDLSNTNDPTYYIAIDKEREELRPAVRVLKSTLLFDTVKSAGENIIKHGDLIMMNHTNDNFFIDQPYASKYHNCTEGNVYTWKGIILLTPAGTDSPSIVPAPDVINNIDLGTNWTNVKNPWGTDYGAWQDVGAAEKSTSSAAGGGKTVTNPDGSKIISTITNSTTTTSQKQERYVPSVSSSISEKSYNLGQFVTQIDILPYLKSTVISFEAHGLKPNTRIWAYFSDVPVSDFCTQFDLTFTDILAKSSEPLRTDNTGSIYGKFYMPSKTFKSDENIFKLLNISSLSQGESAITTSAQATFYGSKLSYMTAKSTLNTRQEVLNITEKKETRTLTNTNTTTDTETKYIDAEKKTDNTPVDKHDDVINDRVDQGSGGDSDDCNCE